MLIPPQLLLKIPSICKVTITISASETSMNCIIQNTGLLVITHTLTISVAKLSIKIILQNMQNPTNNKTTDSFKINSYSFISNQNIKVTI